MNEFGNGFPRRRFCVTGRGLASLLTPILTILISFPGCTPQPTPPPTNVSPQQRAVTPITSVRFEQLDLRLNEGLPIQVVAADSGWGFLHLKYRATLDVHYVNLTVGESWAIQNVPLVSVLGVGAEQSISIAFGLGVAPGTRVGELRYGLTLTDAPLGSAPRPTETAPVNDGQIVFSDGQRGGETPTDPKGPQAPLKGDAVAEDKPHTNDKDFPNQEADKLFCVPVAVSNSLQWLKKTHNIPDDQLPPSDTDIRGWADRFGTTPNDGTPLGPDGKPNWPTKKANYKKPNFPIDTTEVAPGDISKIGEAMDRDCDVELNAESHVASIVGIVRTKDGKYSITIRHDTKQGEAGGTVDEVVTFDPATGKISGGTFLDGTKIFGFVIECYKKP